MIQQWVIFPGQSRQGVGIHGFACVTEALLVALVQQLWEVVGVSEESVKVSECVERLPASLYTAHTGRRSKEEKEEEVNVCAEGRAGPGPGRRTEDILEIFC